MPAEGARLSVVVATRGTADVRRTARDVHASAAAAGMPVEVVVVWQGVDLPPHFDQGTASIDVFPVGLSYARNRGLAATHAALVAFVDDDEAVDEGWVAAVVDAFERHPDIAGITGMVAALDTDGIPYCETVGDTERVFRRASTPPWIIGTGGNMAFRRDDLTAIGGFDVSLGAGAPGRSGEETDVFTRLLRRGRPMVWVPEAIVYHPTKTGAEHLASRQPYAHGAAAVARRNRDPWMAARYAATIGQSWWAGVRGGDAQRRREAARTAVGFVTGLVGVGEATSPPLEPGRVPPQVSVRVGAHPWRPRRGRWAAQPELRYDAGGCRVRVLPGPRGSGTRACGPADAVVHRDAVWVVEPRTRRR